MGGTGPEGSHHQPGTARSTLRTECLSVLQYMYIGTSRRWFKRQAAESNRPAYARVDDRNPTLGANGPIGRPQSDQIGRRRKCTRLECVNRHEHV